MNLTKLITGVFKRKPQFDKIDLGVLKVAFMISALDGEVTDEEYAAFDQVARQCRGYTTENAEKALREAMRAAGYLLLLGRRVDDTTFVKAFVNEAIRALPDNFPFYEEEDLEGVVDMWVSVAESDHDYSPRERTCIEALKTYIQEVRTHEVEWLTCSYVPLLMR